MPKLCKYVQRRETFCGYFFELVRLGLKKTSAFLSSNFAEVIDIKPKSNLYRSMEIEYLSKSWVVKRADIKFKLVQWNLDLGTLS